LGQVVAAITPELRGFIEAQPLFFVASAPLAESGHVNLSPKALDSFRVLSPNQVACLFRYVAVTGGGSAMPSRLLSCWMWS
jgi:hypothetical protein